MCRRFIRLLQGLSFQHADSLVAGPGRHTSLRFLDRSMVATRSLAQIRTYAHHAPALRFSYKRIAHIPDTSKFVTPSRIYSQHLGRGSDLDAEGMIMATEPRGSEAKPADILNEDIHSHQAEAALDPESDEDIPLEAEELKEAIGRPPPVNSSYLPLPWKGRLGYVSCILQPHVVQHQF
jgi:UV DNA damage endonuclease